jgi:hypothetical protein
VCRAVMLGMVVAVGTAVWCVRTLIQDRDAGRRPSSPSRKSSRSALATDDAPSHDARAEKANRATTSWRLFEIQSHGRVVAYCVHAKVAGHRCAMQLDTGYAGSPVLSVSYLTLLHSGRALDDVHAEFHRAGRSRPPRNVDHRTAVRALVVRECRTFTSGCTMRLAGIGAVVEQQADLLLCSAIQAEAARGTGDDATRDERDDERDDATRDERGRRWTAPRAMSGPRADVVVTQTLPHNPHILTSDYMFHVGGVVISPSDGAVHLGPDAVRAALKDTSFKLSPMKLAGGAPVITARIGRTTVTLTLDTGAPGPICISSSAAARLRSRCRGTDYVLRQRGVNGENVCAAAILAPVEVVGMAFEQVVVLVNDLPVAMTDGYVGLAFLSAFDLLVSRDYVGLRPVPGRAPIDRPEQLAHAVVGSCGQTSVCGRSASARGGEGAAATTPRPTSSSSESDVERVRAQKTVLY